jgi:HEPN domain-containing protein
VVLEAGPGSGGRVEGLKFGSLGESYLEQAKVWLRMGERVLKEGNYAFVVLAAQECVKFSLKGLLKKHGVEYPRTHDAGLVVLANKDRLPGNLTSRLDWILEVSRRLAMKRSQAAYGDEAAGIPASNLFDRKTAESALEDASTILVLCRGQSSPKPAAKARLVRKGPTGSGLVGIVGSGRAKKASRQ